MDLGGALAYWVQEDDDEFFRQFRRQPSNAPGMWTRDQVVDYYGERMGVTVTPEQWRFYEVFGLFRLAVIAQQIWYRYYHRQTTNEAYAVFGPAVGYLEQRCRAVVGRLMGQVVVVRHGQASFGADGLRRALRDRRGAGAGRGPVAGAPRAGPGRARLAGAAAAYRRAGRERRRLVGAAARGPRAGTSSTSSRSSPPSTPCPTSPTRPASSGGTRRRWAGGAAASTTTTTPRPTPPSTTGRPPRSPTSPAPAPSSSPPPAGRSPRW